MFTAIALVATLAGTAACGRPATEAECIEIIARITRLEVTEVGTRTAAEIDEEVRGAKAQFADRARKECVGKRIAPNALECVRKAATAKEVVDRCLD
jgi:hypothetical protein